MKQFLSLSFMFCLLLILPGCFCKKECRPAEPKREKRYYQKKSYNTKKQSRYNKRKEAQDEYLPAEYYDEEPMMEQEEYVVPVEQEEMTDVTE